MKTTQVVHYIDNPDSTLTLCGKNTYWELEAGNCLAFFDIANAKTCPNCKAKDTEIWEAMMSSASETEYPYMPEDF